MKAARVRINAALAKAKKTLSLAPLEEMKKDWQCFEHCQSSY
jgi:hypothetical protein